MEPRDPVAPGEEILVLETSLDEVYFALQLLESNRQLSLANRMKIGLPWANTSGSLNSTS